MGRRGKGGEGEEGAEGWKGARRVRVLRERGERKTSVGGGVEGVGSRVQSTRVDRDWWLWLLEEGRRKGGWKEEGVRKGKGGGGKDQEQTVTPPQQTQKEGTSPRDSDPRIDRIRSSRLMRSYSVELFAAKYHVRSRILNSTGSERAAGLDDLAERSTAAARVQGLFPVESPCFASNAECVYSTCQAAVSLDDIQAGHCKRRGQKSK